MTILDELLEAAFKSEGKQDEVNKVYLGFLKAILFVPIKKRTAETVTEEEPFSPLFANLNDQLFMAVFDTLDRLKTWAGEHFQEIEYVELSGRDVVAGINDDVYLSLNIGAPMYKEFSPQEVQRLKMVVSRIDALTSPNQHQ